MSPWEDIEPPIKYDCNYKYGTDHKQDKLRHILVTIWNRLT